ncbi:MAG TPA: hypothetical protein EYG85_02160 [Crocinitomix sp.]|nr:hypothetical protein [Crocinitomix sp.]
MSEIKEDDNEELLYLRSKVDENQKKIANSIKIVIPNNATSQKATNQVFNTNYLRTITINQFTI